MGPAERRQELLDVLCLRRHDIREQAAAKYMSTPVRFCNFSPGRKCHKTAGKGVLPLNNYTRRFRPSSLKCTDKSGLDGLQADKQRVFKAAYSPPADRHKIIFHFGEK